jgi:ABC-2 type transport system ATP-binding protein
MQEAIAISGLVKEFRMPNRTTLRAVDGLDLTVRKGEILGFLGPNGAGKTTTIKMVCGLVRPDQGSITVLGLDAGRQRAEVLTRVGAVLEGNRNIYWDLTVYENLRYFGILKQVPPGALAGRIDELIAFFDLGEKRNVVTKQLSRGMQQKLAIACALIHNPEVLLLDEPTLGLDVAAARMVKERVLQMAREQGRTVVLTTHQLDVAQDLCERVAIIQRGKLRALDYTENLLALFSRQEYEFRVEGRLPVHLEQEVRRHGQVVVEHQNGATQFRIRIDSPDRLYEVMESLKRSGALIQSVQKKEANLEEVFLQITEVKASA